MTDSRRVSRIGQRVKGPKGMIYDIARITHRYAHGAFANLSFCRLVFTAGADQKIISNQTGIFTYLTLDFSGNLRVFL